MAQVADFIPTFQELLWFQSSQSIQRQEFLVTKKILPDMQAHRLEIEGGLNFHFVSMLRFNNPGSIRKSDFPFELDDMELFLLSPWLCSSENIPNYFGLYPIYGITSLPLQNRGETWKY